MRSNCLIVAWLFYRRLKRRGIEAYWSRRPSRKAPVPHWLVMWRLPSGRLHTVSFKPAEPIKRRLPPILFRGRVRWGDWPDTVAEQ